MKIGNKVILKSKNKKGFISDMWDSHLLNPLVFSSKTPTGYKIVTDDGISHICTEQDFELIQ